MQISPLQRLSFAMLAGFLASALAAPGQISLVADLGQTMAVTREDVLAVAKDVFSRPRTSLVVMGPFGKDAERERAQFIKELSGLSA